MSKARLLQIHLMLLVSLSVFLLFPSMLLPDRAPPRIVSKRSAADGDLFVGETLLAPWPVTVAPGVHQLGAMSLSTVYVIETSAGLVLVDAGLTEDHGLLIRQLGDLGLDPNQVRAILLTHAHGDHSLGAMPIKRKTGARIHAGRGDALVLRDGGPLEAVFSTHEMSGYEIHATDVDVELTGDEMLVFGDTRIEVLATPGHTPGSVSYVLNRGGSRIFFAGDTVMTSLKLGTYSAYLAPRYRGDAWAYLATLRRLSVLPIPDILLPGHPRDVKVPQDARIPPAQWSSMLEHGIQELEVLIKKYETDGADFLDGEPKELLPGLHYLGDIDGSAVYGLSTGSQLLLFDAPGGPGFPAWLDSRLQSLGLGSRSVTAVLLTTCGREATSGLTALVEKTQCQVVTSASGGAALRSMGLADARLLSIGALESSGWVDIKTMPIADFRPAAMAYVVKWSGKTVLISGRVPSQGSDSGRETLAPAAGRRADIDAYRESLCRLRDVKPDLWLPAKPLNGRNANVDSRAWFEQLSGIIAKLRNSL